MTNSTPSLKSCACYLAHFRGYSLNATHRSDKATVEITSPYSGKVSNLCGAVGDVIRVGGILCEVEMETEGDSTPTPAPALSPAVELPETVPAVVASTSSTPPAPAPSTPAERRLVSATPATRRLSREHSIDLQAVDGTGKDGRVTKGDVLAYVSALSAAPTPSTRVPSLAPTPTPTGDAIPLSPLRKAMYRAMSATLQTPHFAYSETIDVTALERLRLLLNRSIPPQYLKTLTPAALSSLSSRLAWGNASAVRVPTEERYDRMTLLPLLLKALSSAMSLNPLFLCTLSSSATPALLPRTSHDISLALSAPTGGLFTPLLPSVDTHSPFALASQIAHLQHLSTASSPPKFGEKYSGTGTITLSNVGVVGGRFTHPIIPPTGQLAIGAMGRMRVVPTYVDAKDAKKVAVEGGDSSELRMEPRLMMVRSFRAEGRERELIAILFRRT